MFLSRFCGSWPLAFAPLICLSYSASELSEHFRIWDVHSHLHSVPGNTPEERMTALIQFADRLGIERLLLSQGYSADLHPNPAQLREENDRVMRASTFSQPRLWLRVFEPKLSRLQSRGV